MTSAAAAFDHFRAELDDHNDRRERLIKASRDVTILSKRIIFLLHRLMLDDSPDAGKRAAKQAYEKVKEVQKIYSNIKSELVNDRFYRYQHQVSFGLQEFIEAVGLAHYVEHGTLITFAQVQATLTDLDGTIYFPLTTHDYLLGLSDLTGELMRLAISGLRRQRGRAKAMEICAFVRNCKSDFESLVPYIYDLGKKQAVTSQSLQKIEDACYTLVVRGSEFDLPPEMLDDIVAQTVASFGGNRSGHGHSFHDDDNVDG